MAETPADEQAELRGAAGEANSQSVLTASDVREIRRRFHDEDWTYPQLADAYPVNRDAIKKIIKRQTWSHIEP